MQKEKEKSFFTNYAVLSVVWAVVFTGLIFIGFGWQATVFFVLQAAFSIFFL